MGIWILGRVGREALQAGAMNPGGVLDTKKSWACDVGWLMLFWTLRRVGFEREDGLPVRQMPSGHLDPKKSWACDVGWLMLFWILGRVGFAGSRFRILIRVGQEAKKAEDFYKDKPVETC